MSEAMLLQRYRHLKYLILLLFNAVLFYFLYQWVLKNIHLMTFLDDVGRISLLSMLLCFILASANLMLYGKRLQWIINIPFHQALSITCVGYGFNNIAPFRLGELYRVYYGNRQFGLLNSHIFAGTVIERYLDFMVLLLLGLSMVLLEPRTMSHRINGIFIGLVICGLLSILLYFALHYRNESLLKWLSRNQGMANFIEAFRQAFRSSSKWRMGLVTLVIWTVLLSLYYWFFQINLPDYRVSVGAVIFLCFSTTLLFAIPYTVGGLGAFEAATLFYAIHFLGLDYNRALALALAFHFALGFPQVFWMLVCVAIDKVTMYLKCRRSSV